VPSLQRAGAETGVVNLLNGLDDAIFKKYLFTFDKGLDQYDRLDHNYVNFFIQCRRYKFDPAPVLRIAGLIDTEGIDVIHCTLQFSILLGWLALRISKCKPALVATLHTTLNQSVKEELQDRFIYQWILRRCADVTFVCEKQRSYWLKRYPLLDKNSRVIYNGVNTEYFSPINAGELGRKLRKKLNIPDDAAVIACVAGFRKEKGHADLVRAFASIENRNNTYLLLAGDGETKKEIEALVADRGLQICVRFLGVQQDVRPIFAAADLSVLASTAVETFSNSMLESMSMGKPVLATNLGGLSEAIIPGETGYLVEPGRPDELACAIMCVLSDRDRAKRMGEAARRLVLRKFTLQKMLESKAEALQTVYNREYRIRILHS